jgi:amino acid transporter
MAKKKDKIVKRPRQFGAFSGVFVPTFLSIIGVVLYLRLGYIVGAGGIVSTILIILLSASVTVSTALALSSITTTLKIGPGGGYSIISKTLGLEVGGSVGIPLAFAQLFSVVFYIFGFAEALKYIFPSLPIFLVGYAALGLLLVLTIFNVAVAVRAQIAVFGVILISLVALFLGGGDWWKNILETPLVYGGAEDVSFWVLFALFFPAMTGLQAGIGLSGQLTDPKKQIAKGVLWAIGTTTIIYIAVSFWLGNAASPQELISNNLIMVEKSAFGPAILAGIILATFSSGLTTFVAAPRLIHTMSKSGILPFSKYLIKTTKSGEPINAIILASIIIFFAITLGSLNSIAPLLTMFFLITYATINISVFIEQALGMVSFRPTIKIPKFVSFYGFVVSIIFMFVINPIAGFIALIFLFAVYFWLIKKKLKPEAGDIRSGLFVTIAEWAAKKIITFPESTKHTWKPNILVPVALTRTLLGNFPLIKAIAYPNGTMDVLGIKIKKSKEKVPDAENVSKQEITEELEELPNMVKKFSKEGIFTSSSVVEVDDYTDGVCISLEAVGGQVFHPNILFLPFKSDKISKTNLERIFQTARKEEVGVMLFDRDEEAGLGSEKDIHVWISSKVLENDFRDERKFDLAMLTAYQLYRNWHGKISLWMCTDKDKEDKARYYLNKLVYEARLPGSTEKHVSTDSFKASINKAPQGDIHIISVTEDDIDFIHEYPKKHNKSFLFVADSDKEDILA